MTQLKDTDLSSYFRLAANNRSRTHVNKTERRQCQCPHNVVIQQVLVILSRYSTPEYFPMPDRFQRVVLDRISETSTRKLIRRPIDPREGGESIEHSMTVHYE